MEHKEDRHAGSSRSVAFQPGWSPNGKRIIFSLFQAGSGQVDIFTARADGTDLRQVTNTPDGGGVRGLGPFQE